MRHSIKFNKPPTSATDGFTLHFVFALIVLIFAIGAIGAYVAKHRNDKKTIGNLTPVSIQLEWLHGAEFTGLYTAKEKGYYAAEGLDVSFREFTDGTDTNEVVANKKADYGISSALEIVQARGSGKKIKAIAAIYQTSAYAVVSTKASNIKTPADFRGKVLGNIGDNNAAKVMYAALMANAGVKPSEVTIKSIGFEVDKDFLEGQAETADIYRSDQTYILNQKHIAYNMVYPEQYGFVIYGDVLMTSDAKISQNPTQVAALTRATLKGWQYAIDHQPEALRYNAKYAAGDYKNADYDKYVLAQTAPLVRPTGGKALGSMQFIPWNRAFQGVEAAGLINTKIQASDTYTTQFVD